MINIDVVIPVFNGEKFIARAINSLEKQTFSPRKIIVVDDGSTDSTIEIVKKYENTIPNLVILAGSHKGLSATRNLGIKKSAAEYVAFLDCDDYWLPTKLENQVNHLEMHPKCVAVFSNCNVNDETTGTTYRAPGNGNQLFSHMNLLTQRYRVIGSASSICIRREIFNEIGFFDEGISYGEDYDLWVRISKSHPICEVKNRDVFITKRANSMQTTRANGLTNFRNAILYFKTWSRDLETLKTEKKIFERLIFPDIARAFIRRPHELRMFYEHSSENYSEITKFILPRRYSLVFFLSKNLVWYSIHAIKSLIIRIVR